MPRRELNFQKKIVAYVKSRGGLARLCVQTPYTIVGDPDIYGCYRGQMFLFEVKEEGEQPTAIQLKRRQEWLAVGADVLTVRTELKMSDVILYMDEVM